MSEFNAKEWWADKPSKVWVASLTSTKGTGRRKVQKHHIMYVRAKTSAGAIRTARENTFLVGRLSGTVRLATPTDLGCVAAGEAIKSFRRSMAGAA